MTTENGVMETCGQITTLINLDVLEETIKHFSTSGIEIFGILPGTPSSTSTISTTGM